ncbi:kinase-like domain-containing protein [Xylariomycetidae sp. FL2044]|nr:kinase-like domain-containing protein [Xylariomycetidae sp. FL2044]
MSAASYLSLDESSDYGQSSHYSSSYTYPNTQRTHDIHTATEPWNKTSSRLPEETSTRDFTIPGISRTSAFILEAFLCGVNCIPSHALQGDPSEAGGKGATLDVRKDVFNHQAVALKRIKSEFLSPSSREPKSYQRALADVLFELRVLSHKPLANHRNIPQLLGFSLEDEKFTPAGARETILRPVLVVEWATTDLNSYFLNYQGQSPADCAELVADIADGLQAMHMYGISHADLKPDNVLLYEDVSSASGLVAKLSDFGFSGSEQHQLPTGGDTPHWGAPNREYAIDNTECPGDVFSFGLVAMFVALKGDWDFHLNGAGVKDVERRQANIRDALSRHFVEEEDCPDGISFETWFRRWDDLLRHTVTRSVSGRLTTSGLGSVRRNLTGRYAFMGD